MDGTPKFMCIKNNDVGEINTLNARLANGYTISKMITSQSNGNSYCYVYLTK